MDLYKLLKEALKNPLSFRSASIIFVNLFFLLISAVILFSVVSYYFALNVSARSGCSDTQVKKINSSIKSGQDKIYKLNYQGNNKCFLNAWVTWSKSSENITFWLYDPKGNVSIIDPSVSQTHNYLYSAPPLLKGEWKIVLKTTSNSTINYRGEIGFR